MNTMLDGCFKPQTQGQVPLGKAADGRFVYGSFKPSVVQFSHLLTPFLDGIDSPCDVLPLPRGMTLSKCDFNGQLQITLSDTYARRFRRVYGYVTEIKLDLTAPLF